MHEQPQNALRLLHSSRIVIERHAMVKPLVVGAKTRTLTLTLLQFVLVFVLMFCEVYFLASVCCILVLFILLYGC